ncbi:hypothetical protein [Nonomuraea solani]|nr:hypothetical protein [Nonomuraea solani]
MMKMGLAVALLAAFAATPTAAASRAGPGCATTAARPAGTCGR